MKVWLIFIREERGEATWLEAAWDDESTAENHAGWQAEVDRCRQLADKNGYEMQIASVDLGGVHELFDPRQLPRSEVSA